MITAVVCMITAVAPVSGTDVFVYAVRAFIVLTFLIVAFRLLGKREMSQLSIYDLAMLMALSNAIQNAMTGGRGNLPIGLATSATILLGAWAITHVLSRRPGLERLVIGWPTVIVSDGHIVRNRLRRERVAPEELDEAIRAHGLSGVREVRLGVLEVDGSISIVPLT